VIAVGGHYLDPLPEVLVRASCPFGGGIGGSYDELCGVLSGGVIVLGALWGRVTSGEDDEWVRELACQYQEQFVAYTGTPTCQSIRDSLPDKERRCLPVVEEGARLLTEIIEKARA